jgi:hypothetical protein
VGICCWTATMRRPFTNSARCFLLLYSRHGPSFPSMTLSESNSKRLPSATDSNASDTGTIRTAVWRTCEIGEHPFDTRRHRARRSAAAPPPNDGAAVLHPGELADAGDRELAMIPSSSVVQLHARDWSTVSAWLTSFFVRRSGRPRRRRLAELRPAVGAFCCDARA